MVLRKSIPTIDVPLGTITPPSTELNLYNTLFGLTLPLSSTSVTSLDELNSAMSLDINACPDVFVPGLLSIT